MKKNFLTLVSFMFLLNMTLMAQNPTLETIHQRKSVRSFTDQPVSVENLTTIVKAGMAAPTGMNRQPWEFLVIQDREAMAKLSENLPYAKMLKDAQAAIIVVGNPEKSPYWYLDCSAATQNILLAAESLGLGAVWTLAYPSEERMNIITTALSIPLPYKPLCLIPIGYPKGPQTPKNKWVEAKMHLNKW
ncbi:MAG: NAD(P)H nitroreductase [Bacteroidetes bacterium GWF2_40_14]|nr:MAG: NAD(P)H nitroreductase [Bacteroidetes bacterium GWF2_40_14]